MKLITPILTGLASSLFLNVGFAKIAEKLDPTLELQSRNSAGLPVLSSSIPCSFTPRARG